MLEATRLALVDFGAGWRGPFAAALRLAAGHACIEPLE
jgi:hypothetical protein